MTCPTPAISVNETKRLFGAEVIEGLVQNVVGHEWHRAMLVDELAAGDTQRERRAGGVVPFDISEAIFAPPLAPMPMSTSPLSVNCVSNA